MSRWMAETSIGMMVVCVCVCVCVWCSDGVVVVSSSLCAGIVR